MKGLKVLIGVLLAIVLSCGYSQAVEERKEGMGGMKGEGMMMGEA